MRGEFSESYGSMYPGKRCRTVTFIVTHQCNLRCSYCYETGKSDERMSLETAKRCVDLLFTEDDRGSEYLGPETHDGIILDFIGGEPLLEIDLISETVDYFRKRAMELRHRWAVRYMISMSSNGVLYHDERVRRFLMRNQGRVSMGITLDGDKETHDSCRTGCDGCGSYDLAAAAFADAKARFGCDGTKFTVAPQNVHRVYGACRDMIERFDLAELHLNCVYEEGWDEPLAGEWYRQLKALADWLMESGRHERTTLSVFDPYIGKPLPAEDKQNWCGGTGQMLAFDVDGTIYPCLRYAPLSIPNRPPLRIGDVESGIGVLEEDRKRLALLRSITRQSQSREECLGCPIASGCGWCSAYNYQVHGTPDRRCTYICPTHKARVMAASYYHNRLFTEKGVGQPFPLNIPREWAVPIVGEEEVAALQALAERAEREERNHE